MSLYHEKPFDATCICERCGKQAFIVYRDRVTKEIIGCEECLEKVDANDLEAEQEATMYWESVDSMVDRILERRAGI